MDIYDYSYEPYIMSSPNPNKPPLMGHADLNKDGSPRKKLPSLIPPEKEHRPCRPLRPVTLNYTGRTRSATAVTGNPCVSCDSYDTTYNSRFGAYTCTEHAGYLEKFGLKRSSFESKNSSSSSSSTPEPTVNSNEAAPETPVQMNDVEQEVLGILKHAMVPQPHTEKYAAQYRATFRGGLSRWCTKERLVQYKNGDEALAAYLMGHTTPIRILTHKEKVDGGTKDHIAVLVEWQFPNGFIETAWQWHDLMSIAININYLYKISSSNDSARYAWNASAAATAALNSAQAVLTAVNILVPLAAQSNVTGNNVTLNDTLMSPEFDSAVQMTNLAAQSQVNNNNSTHHPWMDPSRF
jgi:hypothetical protein